MIGPRRQHEGRPWSRLGVWTRGSDPPDCLTAAQVDAVRKNYAGTWKPFAAGAALCFVWEATSRGQLGRGTCALMGSARGRRSRCSGYRPREDERSQNSGLAGSVRDTETRAGCGE